MSTTTNKLADYLKHNKFMAVTVVTGVVALVAIAGVMAWDGGSAKTVATDKPSTSQKADDSKDDKKTEEVAATDQASQTGQVLGDSIDLGTTTNTGNVQVAATTNNSAVVNTPSVTPPAPATETPATPAPVDPTPVDPTPTDPAKFDKARVSLTFDDGWKSIHDNALPILTKYGLKSTQYVNGEPTLKSDPASPQYDYWTGYMGSQDISDFVTAGHEIAWHTNTHTYDLTTATAEQRTAELTPTTDFINLLMNVNVTVSDNFAAPFGTQSAESAAAAKAAGYNSYRTTYDGYNTKGATDVMSIKVKNVCAIDGVEACNGLKTTVAEVASWIAAAQAQNAWLVIVYHEVSDAPVVESEYSVSIAEFDAQMNAIKQSNVEVVTVEQALIDLTPQL